jgi:hypothetical protein
MGSALIQLIRHFSEADAVERLSVVIFGLSAAWATFWTNACSFIYTPRLMSYVVLKALRWSKSPAIKVAVMSAFLLRNKPRSKSQEINLGVKAAPQCGFYELGMPLGTFRAAIAPFFEVFRGLTGIWRQRSRNFAPGGLVISTDPNLVTLVDARVDCVRLFNKVVCRRGLPASTRPGGPARPTGRTFTWLKGALDSYYSSTRENPWRGSKREKESWEDVVKGLTAGRRLVASMPYRIRRGRRAKDPAERRNARPPSSFRFKFSSTARRSGSNRDDWARLGIGIPTATRPPPGGVLGLCTSTELRIGLTATLAWLEGSSDASVTVEDTAAFEPRWKRAPVDYDS